MVGVHTVVWIIAHIIFPAPFFDVVFNCLLMDSMKGKSEEGLDELYGFWQGRVWRRRQYTYLYYDQEGSKNR